MQTGGSICGVYVRARYVVALLASAALFINYGLRVNMSIAIVRMINFTAIHSGAIKHPKAMLASEYCYQEFRQADLVAKDECETPKAADDEFYSENGPFEWNTSQQGMLLSIYFWGYIVTMFAGGRIAETTSAKMTIFISTILNIICSIVTPASANAHYMAAVAVRFIQGAASGVMFPATHALLAHWAPKPERSIMTAMVYAGTSLGTVAYVLLTGIIGDKLGWEAIFYIEGAVSAVWCPFWWIIVRDSPVENSRISDREREYIRTSLNEPSEIKIIKVPWKAIFTSPPFWAIFVAHTCQNWIFYLLLMELPSYLKQVLHYKILDNGILTAIPYLTMFIFTNVLGVVLDQLRFRKTINTTTARKSSTLIGCVIPGICFTILGYTGCNRTYAVTLLVIAVTSCGGMWTGFLSNHIDIAPNFAGTLMGMINTVATIPGMAVGPFVGWITSDDKRTPIESWRIVFFTAVGAASIEAIFYTIFASGEEQKWNLPTANEGNRRPDGQEQTSVASTAT